MSIATGRAYAKPQLEVFGSFRDLTLMQIVIKGKTLGFIDDFGVQGVADPASR